MKSLIALLLLAVAMFAAEEKPAEDKKPEISKIVELRNMGPDNREQFSRMMDFVRQLMFPYKAVESPTLRTIYLRGPEDVVNMAETMLRKFDAAAVDERPRQVQLNLYVLAPAEEASGRAFPADLAAAAEQLRNTFGFKAFQLVDTIIMRGRESAEFWTNGLVAGETVLGQAATYSAGYKSVQYSPAQKNVAVNGFRFDVRFPYQTSPNNFQMTETSLRTDLTIRDGQKLVLGKLTKSASDKPLFVVLTSKVE